MSVLFVGGLDPSGQAGLARDLEVAARMRVHAAPVPTCLTVQDGGGLVSLTPVPVEEMVAMLEAAWQEVRPSIMKVGAVPGPAHAQAIARFAGRHGLDVVLDPVLETSPGGRFCAPEDLAALLDVALIATPNEAEARHLGLEDAPGVHVTRGGSVPGRHRGTGCRYAATVACLLAVGVDVTQVLDQAHALLERELRFDSMEQALAGRRREHWSEARRALWCLLGDLRGTDVPEVGINFAYALPGATSDHDVCGLAGRIAIAGDHLDWTGRIAFGGPHHTGRIVLVVQEYDPSVRIVMNHRFDERYLAAARAAGLVDAGFSRADEPPDVPSTMEWGVRHCIERLGRVPDLIWDRGGDGKEPMIRVLAEGPDALVEKLRILHGSGDRHLDASRPHAGGHAPMDPRRPGQDPAADRGHAARRHPHPSRIDTHRRPTPPT